MQRAVKSRNLVVNYLTYEKSPRLI